MEVGGQGLNVIPNLCTPADQGWNREDSESEIKYNACHDRDQAGQWDLQIPVGTPAAIQPWTSPALSQVCLLKGGNGTIKDAEVPTLHLHVIPRANPCTPLIQSWSCDLSDTQC